MTQRNCHLIGAPVDSGKRRKGCLMGPDAYRTAGLAPALVDLGCQVTDHGNLSIPHAPADQTPTAKIHAQDETVAWVETLSSQAAALIEQGFPIFMGGDHSLTLGSLPGVASYAAQKGQAQFVLWLDAHADFHTPQTTGSGNLHGTPLAYATGQPGFDAFPKVSHPVPAENVCILGLRSVDGPEKAALSASQITYHDMRSIDEHGIARPLKTFLDRVAQVDGALHVSLDVDFLDPMIAPAVGTTVPGGATLREAHLVMEILYDSGLMTSLDLVELNPFLDERGRTAKVMVDLAASAMGRRVFDRQTHSFD